MRTHLSSLLLLLSLIAQVAPAHAQATGLRLKGNLETVSEKPADSGLRLHFTSLGPSSEPTTTETAAFDSASIRNSLRADLPLIGYGLRTSLGISWNSLPAYSSTGAARGNAWLDATPFLGIGWQGRPKESRWSLSAEVGTAFAGSCSGAMASCAGNAARTGFSTSSNGSGLKLNPYVNFGATFHFGD